MMKGGETTKRLCIIFMAAAIFCIAMFPGKGFAYSGGLLNGKAMMISTTLTGGTSTLAVTDDKPTTYIDLQPGQKLRYDFPVEAQITHYQYSGTVGVSYGLNLYNQGSGSKFIGVPNGNVPKTAVGPYNNVQSVYLENNQTSVVRVYDFDVWGTTGDTTPPVAPTGLVLVPGQEKLTFSWDANKESDLRGYFVYLNGIKVSQTPTTALSYVFNNLTGGTTYTVSVSAVDTSDNESQKSSLSGKPNSPPPPPDTTPPTVPVLQGKPGKGQAILTWTRSPESDLAGYNLYQDGQKVGNYTTNGATVSGLKNGDTYKFQVTAIDTTGNESAKSNQVSVIPVEKMDVNLIPNGDSIVVQIVSGGTGPYVINWGAAQKTVDQSQYVIQNLQFDTEYTVTITDANGLTYTGNVNTGTEKGYIPPTFPNPQDMFQKMLDVFGTAGTIAIAVIGGAVALGLLVLLAYWGWLLLKRWIARTK